MALQAQKMQKGAYRPPALAAPAGAHLHNLQKVDVAVPLNWLVAVTGVSGSGKSTLARDVLLTNAAGLGAAAQYQGRAVTPWTPARPRPRGSTGLAALKPLTACWRWTRPPSANPAQLPRHLHRFLDTIRKLFAETLEAKARGYAAGRFSFNTGEGRCPSCEGCRACAPSE